MNSKWTQSGLEMDLNGLKMGLNGLETAEIALSLDRNQLQKKEKEMKRTIQKGFKMNNNYLKRNQE